MSAATYIRNDRWSITEDRIMRAAVMKYGTNQWNRVASLITRKSASQCRSRWFEHLDPRIARGSWSVEEDNRLLQLQERMPNMWRSIGTTLGGRSAQQCYERWQELQSSPEDENEKENENEAEGSDQEGEESNGSDLDSDSERQLVAEARARLSNSLGRKAKRKQRERNESNKAFEESIERYRESGTLSKPKNKKQALSAPQVQPPVPFLRESMTLPSTSPMDPNARDTDKKVSKSKEPALPTNVHQPRKPNRPKLELPPVQSSAEDTDSQFKWVFSQDLTNRVLDLLHKMPAPKGISLVELYTPGSEVEKEEVEGVGSDEIPDVRSGLADTSLNNSNQYEIEDDNGPISEEARNLVRMELESLGEDPPIEHSSHHRVCDSIIDALKQREALLSQIRSLNETN